ncbi:MAG: zinc-dependent metalloprotease, partial [Chitinophagaceae bacterium]|nr:zinc-dependent metalloprotease [Chitinophagaceae bacterium]
SIVLLPERPMKRRAADPRVGYFSTGFVDYDSQSTKNISFIKRWRLEPFEADMEKYRHGELVAPQKPIVFYIDPATPKKWVPYLIQGVNDWQKAFEKAGFKNAIYAREAPSKEEDSTWSLEDARFSAIVYKASPVTNASGPSIADPRSGEILESHINWYHNITELLYNWYLIQASPSDSAARATEFGEELMGQLIRFVSSHEVGHTLGLRHNFGSSSTVPVDSLRNQAWLDKHGHTPSIMDYARFNYVAQPEDHISRSGLFPKINDYDIWAIEWGYRLFPDISSIKEEKKFLNTWIIDKTKNKRLWFGSEMNLTDPRTQSEALGDDAFKAGLYGIKNLKFILPKLREWVYAPGEDYSSLRNLYLNLASQFSLYLRHVRVNIGGQYSTYKTMDEKGSLYQVVPKAVQQKAVQFLNEQLFKTPAWLLDMELFARIGMDAQDFIMGLQDPVLREILSSHTLVALNSATTEEPLNAYTISAFLMEIRSGIWGELKTNSLIDIYRRNLQKKHIEILSKLIVPKNSVSAGALNLPPGFTAVSAADPYDFDICSIVKIHLKELRSAITKSMSLVHDRYTKYHLQDCIERITMALDDKTKK